MLEHLHISGYALIDSLDLDFPAGLSTVTGETGAGKSIMLGALSLLTGRRADSRKTGAGKTVVEATFLIDPSHPATELLTDLDIDPAEDSRLILRREINAAGRSRAFVNDTPVSLSDLGAVAARVLDIHAQQANALLRDAAYQLDIIDSYGSLAPEVARYRAAYDAYRTLRHKIDNLKKQTAKAAENEEFLRFRLEYLRRLAPKSGEHEHLENQLEILSGAEALTERLAGAHIDLSATDTGALDKIASAESQLRRINLSLFPEAADLPRRLESVRIELTDIASTIAQCRERVDNDPAQLEKTERRLDQILEAMNRLNVSTEQELLALKDKLEREYASLSGNDADLPALEKELHEHGTTLKQAAATLSARRSQAAKTFAADLLDLARPLGLDNLRISFTLTTGKFSPTGADVPALLVAFNKKQELRPVQDVASGGEISRLMLCLKALIASKMQLPSVIFDEVDTGVSGDIAHRMGALMHSMGTRMQVMAITHLPQVAAWGDAQYKVFKTDTDEATHTHVSRLSPSARVDAIAAMLAGGTITQAALQNARDLLDISR